MFPLNDQAMHSVISIARRKQPLSVSRAGGEDDLAPGAVENESLDRRGERGGVGGVAEALLRRGKNLEQLVSNLARAMDLHQAVAPLQWICLVCLIDLHELEARVSDIFMIRSGCQILHRCACVVVSIHRNPNDTESLVALFQGNRAGIQMLASGRVAEMCARYLEGG